MTGESTFLEKYSVAPAPSRDYYGIRIFQNEIKLYLWKISHGPHKTPSVKNANFEEFASDKSLQGEIGRVFGESLLDRLSDIASRRTNSWEENIAGELDRGWARVLSEGRSMQDPEKKNVAMQLEKKRKFNATRARGKINLRARSRAPAKTPLEVAKINSTSKDTIGNKSSEAPERKARFVPGNDAFDDETKGKTTKSLGRIADAAKAKRSEIAEERKKIAKAGKSIVITTDEGLTGGFSSCQERPLNLAELIREETAKIRERTRALGDSRSSKLNDDVDLSAVGDAEKSSSCDYAIKNTWSSNSTIDSVRSPNVAGSRDKFPSKIGDKSSNRFNSAREFSPKRRTVSERERKKVSRQKTDNKSMGIWEKRSFPKIGVSAGKTVDQIDRSIALAVGKSKLESLNSKLSRIEKTSGLIPSRNEGSLLARPVTGVRVSHSKKK